MRQAVGAVILAAGGSSRFGKPKQLARFENQTLIERSISAAADGGCQPVVVVVGASSSEVMAAVPQRDVIFARNPDWPNGIGTSIRVGVQRLLNVAPDNAGAVLMVCDQPLVSRRTIEGVIREWSNSDKPILASKYAQTLGVPAVFGRSCFQELLQLEGDTGAKPVILKDLARVAEMPFPEGSYDIDTAADLAEAERTGV